VKKILTLSFTDPRYGYRRVWALFLRKNGF
jgi:hypothetical protein